MVDRVDVAEVHLWGQQIGAVAWNESRRLATFEYHPAFLRSSLEPAPLTMPLGTGLFQFPQLAFETYRGLPGLLADSLPDRFGNDLIDAWLARQGRDRATFSPVERLCYIGSRGMGALEYHPAHRGRSASAPIHVDQLVDLAKKMLSARGGLQVDLDDEGLTELLRVGTSAGGARAKAIVAWNPKTDEVRSGQVPAPDGFEYWILKFDGVGSFDRKFADPEGYGRIEYAYHLMARDAGLVVSRSRLFIDQRGRAHFMTRRFDRSDDGDKFHSQTLAAMAHLDFNEAGAHSYEQALATTLQICGAVDLDQMFRRMVFNVVSRNQDDHTKNITFVMDRSGLWHLSPAYDVTWAYNPSGRWTSRHQMTIGGKRDEVTRSNLLTVAQKYGIRTPESVIDQVVASVADWKHYASEAEVEDEHRDRISPTHRLL